MTAVKKTQSVNGESSQPKMEVKKNEPKIENTILSLEKRIQKVEELNVIIDKWRKLNEARQNMKSFTLANDSINATVTLHDATGREFKTSNSLVVNSVLNNVLNELDKSIESAEEQINFAA